MYLVTQVLILRCLSTCLNMLVKEMLLQPIFYLNSVCFLYVHNRPEYICLHHVFSLSGLVLAAVTLP